MKIFLSITERRLNNHLLAVVQKGDSILQAVIILPEKQGATLVSTENV